VRVVPHVNDTLLLVAAIGLSIVLQQYPFVHAWVTAKVLGLLAYIGLGMFALRRGRSKAPARRLLAGLAGQLRLHRLGGAHQGPARPAYLGGCLSSFFRPAPSSRRMCFCCTAM
jgi:threonine/homoserine/homoserine lactone efflux protein